MDRGEDCSAKRGPAMITPPTSGPWFYESHHGTTAPTFHFANQPPAIYRSVDDPHPIEGALGNSLLLTVHRVLERQIQAPLSASTFWRGIVPSKSYAEEVLDWDDAISKRPSRPTITMQVTLEYAGLAKPSSISDDWD